MSRYYTYDNFPLESPEGFKDDITDGKMVINFGPQHPAMHGTLRLALEIDGEKIVKAIPEIGFLHTGFEKLGENRSYNQFIPITDRMNYLSSLNNNIGYAIACEELMGIEVPKRAQYLRVIFAEASRIADHLICIGLQGMDLGAFSVMLWTFIEREKAYDVFELVTGGRMTTSYTRIGGLARDVDENFASKLKSLLGKWEQVTDEIEFMLSNNRIFTDRTKGIGVISKEDAINYGLTGPCLRASGVQWDIRKACPYSSYEDFDFEVPVLNEGDTFSRYKIRCEEVRQSIRIIEQALENLPDGEVNISNHKVRLPSKDEVYNTMEGLIHNFKLIMKGHGIKGVVGEHYSSTEAPNGELGFYIVSDGTGNPYRIRVRPPSFIHYAAFPKLLEGHLLSDIVSILSSLNVIAGELDR